jgi:hypothetical protein
MHMAQSLVPGTPAKCPTIVCRAPVEPKWTKRFSPTLSTAGHFLRHWPTDVSSIPEWHCGPITCTRSGYSVTCQGVNQPAEHICKLNPGRSTVQHPRPISRKFASGNPFVLNCTAVCKANTLHKLASRSGNLLDRPGCIGTCRRANSAGARALGRTVPYLTLRHAVIQQHAHGSIKPLQRRASQPCSVQHCKTALHLLETWPPWHQHRLEIQC